MKIETHGGNVKIYETGIKLLKLKTELSSRIGNLVSSNKDYISFPASALHLVEDLLSAEGVSFDSIAKAQIEKFKHHKIARTTALSIMEGELTSDLPIHWQNILDPAQLTATAAMTVPDLIGLCLFDEQGSGKTVMTIASFDILKDRDEIDAMIVVCPKSMISEWPKDIAKFCSNKYTIVTAEGSRKDKYDASFKNFDVLVTNYEGVEAMLVSLMASASTKRFLLVADESYYLKNSQSIRSGNISRLREKCQKCYVLCGTPAPNSAHDLINQFDLSDLGFTFGGFKKSKDPEADWKEIALLTDSKGLFIRRLKTDILEHVPEKNFNILRVAMTGKQKLMYESARSELELELKNLNNEAFKKKLVTYFQKRSVLLNICSSPNTIDPTLSEISVKYEVLDELLDDLISKGRKVIIWSSYRNSLDEIHARYSRYKPVRVDGSISADARKKAIKSFQEDPETMLFIGNPAAAGAGITLHSSYDAIYFSYSSEAAHYLQSLDRIHRRGQISDEVNYYLLMCEGTIEETEIIRLRGKEVQQHNLLGDHIKWPTSLDDALEELKAHE